MKEKIKNLFKRISELKIFPRRFFIYSPKYLVYVDITKTLNFIFVITFLFAFFIGFFAGGLTTSKREKIIELPTEIFIDTKYDHAVGDTEWKDYIFNDYHDKAELYLSQEQFYGTPIKADMLSLAARNAYDSTGILLPLELALSQAQWESGMGMTGRSPEKNPYNVGEWDNGTVKYFETTFDGIQAYYYLMCNDYLKCKSLNELFINFTNCGGFRYASTPTYERKIKYQYFHIQQWLKENYKPTK